MANRRIVDLNDEAVRQEIWEKGIIVENYDKDSFRQDVAGAWISRNAYGDTNSVFGWVIDHIYPQSLGGEDDIDNLRPMHWRNNLSKKDDYPHYTAVVVAENNRNIERETSCTVNKNLQKILNELYNVN